MRLTVNGINVPVADHIDIILETNPNGETLSRGIRIEFQGGQLIVEQSDRPPLEIFGERQTSFEATTDHAAVVNWGETMNHNTFQGDRPLEVHAPSKSEADPGVAYTLKFECKPYSPTWHDLPSQL